MRVSCPTPTKIGFMSLRLAVEGMVRTHDRLGVWQRPYLCGPGCGDYHLTTLDLSGNEVTDDQAREILRAFEMEVA